MPPWPSEVECMVIWHFAIIEIDDGVVLDFAYVILVVKDFFGCSEEVRMRTLEMLTSLC